MTESEFKSKMEDFKKTLADLFAKGETLNKEIQESIDRLHYDKKI